MKNKISFIIPSFEKETARKLGEWILDLPELKLIADYDINIIEWKKEVTGSDQDWFAMADAVIKKWNTSDGFIVWAPERSVLEQAGVLKLLFRAMGKPIVVFSADKPERIANDQFAMYGLKSVLISAAYTALSALAEIMILSDGKLFKPEGCYWSEDEFARAAINSVYEPLASIDFALNIYQEHDDRQANELPEQMPESLNKAVYIPQMIPSLPQNMEWPGTSPRAVVLPVDDHVWQSEELAQLREKAIQENVSAIFYSKERMKKSDLRENELMVFHPNFWWTVLVTQFSLAKFSSAEKALKMIKSLV